MLCGGRRCECCVSCCPVCCPEVLWLCGESYIDLQEKSVVELYTEQWLKHGPARCILPKKPRLLLIVQRIFGEGLYRY